MSHEYFLDEMQLIDLCIATKYLEFAEVNSWNQIRQLMLCQLKPYLKKKDLTAQELFPLPIDDDGIEHTIEVSNEDVSWFKKFRENYKNKGSK